MKKLSQRILLALAILLAALGGLSFWCLSLHTRLSNAEYLLTDHLTNPQHPYFSESAPGAEDR